MPPDPALALPPAIILEALPDACFVVDHDGRLLYVNARSEVLLGRPRADLLGRRLQEALPEALASDVAGWVQVATVTGEPAVAEAFYPPLQCWLRISVQPVPGALLVFLRDVSERVAADSALRASEEKFTRAFSASPLILTITRIADGRFVDVNESFVSATGWARAEALGRTPIELGLWTAPAQRELGLARLRMGAPLRNVEARFRLKSGDERTGLLAADVMLLDGEPCVLSAVVDITERKQAEAALARYRLLSDYTRDIVLFVRPDGRIADANAAAVTAYGYDAATLRRLTIHDLRDEETHQLLPVQLAQADSSGVRFETLHRRRDGATFPVEVTSRGADVGGERLLLSIVRDISDRKVAEEERDAFLSGVTHDLKTPLTAIQGAVQLAQRALTRKRPDAVERTLDALGAIERAGGRMLSMIDELVDLARVKIGEPLELRLGPLDLVALARGVVDELQELAGAGRVTVVAEEPALHCTGDQRRLERVVMNLLVNAIKYSPPDSPITLSVRSEPDGHRRVAVLNVADSGVGIPAGDLPHIFERFYRGRNVIERTAGTGIGLAGAKQIVEAHGGTITAESTEGRGTAVTVRLPCARPPDPRYRGSGGR